MSNGLTIAIADLYVGTPRPLGDEGLGITSAIHKLRVDPDTSLRLDRINLAGDDQADRSVHGGPDKAVYAHPDEHRAAWATALAQPDLVTTLATAGAGAMPNSRSASHVGRVRS